MSTAIVTDSNSQLPQSLQRRYDIRVVPIPVVVNGVGYLEGVDLDADRFYELFDGDTPDVSTSQPSPGAFVDAYRQCADAGHDRILSIHVGGAFSGTLNSARVAAELVDIDVRLVDSRTFSFGISCCVWRAAQMLEAQASMAEIIAVIDTLADRLYSVTALGAAELLKASGRVEFAESGRGIDVFLSGPDGGFASIGAGANIDEVCDLMADTMHLDGAPIQVALGIADASAAPYYSGLEDRLAERCDVTEIVRYRIGPSVGAFTGLGTAGGFWW